MTNTLNISIAGIAGRMGRQIGTAGIAAGHQIVGGSEASGSAHIGADLMAMVSGASTLKTVSDNPEMAATGADVWIDFTVPAATLSALSVLPGQGVRAAIIGTTGFSAEQDSHIAAAAKSLAIVKAGNFSLGVNLLQSLVRQAAARLGPEWDIEILETHHRRKVDAPSGTALMLGEAAATGRGADLQSLKAAPYDGPDAKRESGQIGFASRRSGGVIGEHEVSFGSDQEVVSLSHTALDRSVFAHGAIKAAEWAVNQPPGLYDISDVLGV